MGALALRRFVGFSVILFSTVFINSARADSLCDFYRKSVPSLYKIVCNGRTSSTKPAGATSTFSNSFNMNSASLPTEPSNYGFESIVSYIRKDHSQWSPTFSLVKGFHKFGTGISTSGNNTFYGNDIMQRIHGPSLVDTFKPREDPRGELVNLNIGTAVTVFEKRGGLSTRLGLTARYNKTTDTWGGGSGLSASWKSFTAGFGFSRERVSFTLPRIYFLSSMISARAWIFEFEYNLLKNADGYRLSPIHIGTVTASIYRFTLTAAIRKLNYVQEGDVVQMHYGLQYLFSKHFSAGLLFNFIPGANSLGMQFYL